MILDQSLKTWDVSLQSTGERLFYKGSDYRSLGIYSKNSKKFALGYNEIISGLGNYVPTDESVNNIISATRSINDDGLLSIVSHSTNQNEFKILFQIFHLKMKKPYHLLLIFRPYILV